LRLEARATWDKPILQSFAGQEGVVDGAEFVPGDNDYFAVQEYD
jgi:hypothetical protein